MLYYSVWPARSCAPLDLWGARRGARAERTARKGRQEPHERIWHAGAFTPCGAGSRRPTAQPGVFAAARRRSRASRHRGHGVFGPLDCGSVGAFMTTELAARADVAALSFENLTL